MRLAVDVTLEIEREESGKTDSVRKTLDYRKVHQRVVELGRGTSHKLLESFAWSLIQDLLERFPAARVTLRVRKETPVLDGIVDSVGVEMSRTRDRAAGP